MFRKRLPEHSVLVFIGRHDDHVSLGWVNFHILRPEAKRHIRRLDVLRQRDFRVAMTGQVTSQIADAMTSLGLAQVLLFDLNPQDTVTAFLRGLVLAAFPLLFVGPLAGVLADRFERNLLLRRGQHVRALLTVGAVLSVVSGSSTIGYATFGLLLLATRVLYTVRAISIPRLVEPHQLVAADSAALLLSMVAGIIGVGVAAGLQVLDIRLVFLAATAMHIASSCWYSQIRVVLGGGPDTSRSNSVRDWRAALAQLQHPKVRFSIGASGAGKLLLGLGYASIALVVDARFNVEATGYAAVFGVAGIGTFLGTLTAERVTERMPRKSVSVVAGIISSFAFGGVIVVDVFLVAMAAIAVASFAFQNVRVCNDAAVQSNVNSAALGRVFAAYDVVYNLSFVGGAALGLVVGTGVGHAPILVVCCLGYAALALAASFHGSGEALPTRNTVSPASAHAAASNTLRVSNTTEPFIVDAISIGETLENSSHSVSTTSASAPKHAPVAVSA